MHILVLYILYDKFCYTLYKICFLYWHLEKIFCTVIINTFKLGIFEHKTLKTKTINV